MTDYTPGFELEDYFLRLQGDTPRGDEFFFVLEGKLLLEVENDSVREHIELSRFQGYTVPMGIMHKTSASEKTVMLMIEKKTVQPTGDN